MKHEKYLEFSNKEKRYHEFYMDVAYRASQLSFAKRRQVGAIAVAGGNITGFGFNGTPAGEPNICEDESGNTLPSVLHAEENLIGKLKNSTGYFPPFDVYITTEPCVNCATKLKGFVGLKRVFYREKKRTNSGEGPNILIDSGKEVFQM